LLERYWLGKSQIPERNPSQYHCFYRKSHTDWPGSN